MREAPTKKVYRSIDLLLIFFQPVNNVYRGMKEISFLFFSALVLSGTIFFGQPIEWPSSVLACIYLLAAGYYTGHVGIGLPTPYSFALAPIVVLVEIGVMGSPLYLASALSTPVILFLLWVPFICALLSHIKAASPFTVYQTSRDLLSTHSILGTISLLFSSFFSCGFIWYIYVHRTYASLLGPWDQLSVLPFVIYAAASLLLLLGFLCHAPLLLSLCAVMIYFFASYSVALVRFPLVFGFDPLLHHAAEKLVLGFGAVNPKTLYYVAQYTVVPFIARVTSLPVEWVHQPLLPLVLSMSVPALAFLTIRSLISCSVRSILLLVIAFLTVLYPDFIMTTPWGLAYGTTFLTILSSGAAVGYTHNRLWIVSSGLFLFTLFLHPLAGIPLAGFLCILVVFLNTALSTIKKRIASVVLVSLFSAGIPAAFFINSALSGQLPVQFHLPSWTVFFPNFSALLFLETRFSPLLDIPYAVYSHGVIIGVVLSLIGLALVTKKDIFDDVRKKSFFNACFTSAFISFANAFFVSYTITFPTLASFEQNDYARRLVLLGFLFLVPFCGVALAAFFEKLLLSKKIYQITLLLCMTALLVSSLYLSYPRNDAYTPFHGHSLSKSDMDAARFIDQDGGDAAYIVLANQVVASAAIKEFGFKKYFSLVSDNGKEPLFYYPIPSGSPLASYYYGMLKAPSKKIMAQAMDWVGVDSAYFVVHDYEPRFPIILRDAMKSAQAWYEIDDGAIVIFKYQKESE